MTVVEGQINLAEEPPGFFWYTLESVGTSFEENRTASKERLVEIEFAVLIARNKLSTTDPAGSA